MFLNPQASRRVLKEFKATQEFLHLVQPIHRLQDSGNQLGCMDNGRVYTNVFPGGRTHWFLWDS